MPSSERPINTKIWLDQALLYAESTSGCNKVAVGSAIVADGCIVALGANRTIPNLCRNPSCGCLRVEKYGNDSKAHRDPADCRAIHSEVDAICSAASQGHSVKGAKIFVTRYPCENCARAIVAAGISTVYYGGTSTISKETQDILETGEITAYHVDWWREDNTDR